MWAQVDHWESLVIASDDWQYLVPNGQGPETGWQNLNFLAAGWETGPGGFGYGDGDDNTQIPNTPSVYLRHMFQVEDLADIEELALQIDYDDAFVAYLNGSEIVRAGDLPGGGEPDWNTLAIDFVEPLLPNGQIPTLRVIPQALWQGLLSEGENVLAIQVHNVENSSDLSSNAWLHAGMLTDETIYQELPDWFELPFILESSNLPIIILDVDNSSIPDEPKINVPMRVINNGNGQRNYLTDTIYQYEGAIGIELRGSTSQQFFPKKSYAVETRDALGENLNVSLLGLPEENDWIFYGPYSDKTLMRNAMAMHMSRSMGNYASRFAYFELVMNGDYRGLYLLMEKVKRDSNRVDIADLNIDDLEGDEVTGGYIIKIDKFTGADTDGWSSNFTNDSGSLGFFQFHYPKSENIQNAQVNYIRQFIEDFETALKNDQFENGEFSYRDFIDMDSFVDFMIVSELTRNIDAYRLSTFLFKDKDSNGGKLHLGPVWDFNIAFGNANYCQGENTSNFVYLFEDYCPGDEFSVPFWWRKLMQDEFFLGRLKCRWKELRLGALHTDSLHQKIDNYESLLQESSSRNFDRWNILNEHVWPNAIVSGSYVSEVDYLRSFIEDRTAWLDVNIPGICLQESSLHDLPEEIDYLFVASGELKRKGEMIGQFELFDAMGQSILRSDFTELEGKWYSLPSGVYLYRFRNALGRSRSGRLLK